MNFLDFLLLFDTSPIVIRIFFNSFLDGLGGEGEAESLFRFRPNKNVIKLNDENKNLSSSYEIFELEQVNSTISKIHNHARAFA